MKNDMEYNKGQEFPPLPDEYLQGGGNKTAENGKKRSVWKQMMYMTATLAVMAYTAVGAYASEIPVLLQTDKNPPVSDEKENTTDKPVSNGQIEQTENNITLESLPFYPVEDLTSYYVVYNDTCDVNNNWNNLILEEGFLFESLLLQGMEQALPEHEPADGYTFLGWVMHYADRNYGMAGDTLNTSNVCHVKPENGSRSIEVHAAWRHNGIGEYPYLLRLDANGGKIEGETSVTYDAQGPMISGSTVYLCAYPIPEREGYVFAGWYNDPDCSGNPVKTMIGMDFYEKNGDEYDFSKLKQITLYAGWVKN